MAHAHWLVKSEPFKYSFANLQRDGSTVWDGVRNYEARNNLRAMKLGDVVLFYHSGEDKAVVGVARVSKEAYPDPTADDDTWSVVEIEPVVALKQPVTLDEIRDAEALSQIAMVKKGRISVTPVTAPELEAILSLGKTKLPKAPSKKKLARQGSPRRPAHASTLVRAGCASSEKWVEEGARSA